MCLESVVVPAITQLMDRASFWCGSPKTLCLSTAPPIPYLGGFASRYTLLWKVDKGKIPRMQVSSLCLITGLKKFGYNKTLDLNPKQKMGTLAVDSWSVLLCAESRGQHTFSAESQEVNILSFVRFVVSVTTMLHCHFSQDQPYTILWLTDVAVFQ